MLRRAAIVIVDGATVAGAAWLAYLIRFDFDVWPYYQTQLIKLLPVIVLLRIASLYFFGGYQSFWRYCGINDLFSVIRGVAFGSVALISVDYLKNHDWALLAASGFFLAAVLHRISLDKLRLSRVKRLALSVITSVAGAAVLVSVLLFTRSEQTPRTLGETPIGAALDFESESYDLGIPRSVVLLEGILAFLAISFVRLAPRLSHDLRGQRQAGGRRVAIYGAGDFGESVARALMRSPEVYQVVGFLDDDPAKRYSRIHGLRVFGGREKLADILSEHAIQEVLIAVDELDEGRLSEVVTLCRTKAVAVRKLPKLSAYLSGRVDVSDLPSVSGTDLLGRQEVQLNPVEIEGYLRDKVVLVSGAGGSIGSELCRQIAAFSPQCLVMLGKGEASIHSTIQNLSSLHPQLQLKAIIGDIRNEGKVDRVMAESRPHIVFHAAAHKHVPFMEQDPDEAVSAIFLGTCSMARSALRHGVERFVLISTDKAVRPTSVMGATKRLAETEIQRLAAKSENTRFVTVRFGNVLGSRGSVVPIFERQIRQGGPVTVTHPEMYRYLMTIPEAVRLVLHSAAVGQNGELCILDMGDPVRILDLAENMIRLAGLEPYRDIKIEFTGIRPGEKLSEELVTDEQVKALRHHGKIAVCAGRTSCLTGWDQAVEELRAAAKAGDRVLIRELLKRYVPDYRGWEADG